MKPFLFMVFSVVVITVSIGSRGDDALVTATTYFEEGVALFNQGEFLEAGNKFRQANQMKFNWKLLYNIAQCEAAAKRHGLALQTFEEYLSRGGDDVTIERQNEVREEIRRLREMVGFLKVEGPDGATVFVDDMEREQLPLVGLISIAAGVAHTVRVVQKNNTLLERRIRVPGQQTILISTNDTQSTSDTAEPVSPVDDPSSNKKTPVAAESATSKSGVAANDAKPSMTETPLATDQASARRHRLRTTGIVMSGVGAALLIAGGITGGVAMSKGKSLESDYGDQVPYTARSEYNQMRSLADVSTAFIISGAVVAATGVVLLIVSGKSETLATVRPVIGNHLAGIGVGGKF